MGICNEKTNQTKNDAPATKVEVVVNNTNTNAGSGNKAAPRKPSEKKDDININMTGCNNNPVIISKGNGNITM